MTAKLALRRLLGKADAPTRERMLPLDPRPRLPQVVNLQGSLTSRGLIPFQRLQDFAGGLWIAACPSRQQQIL